MLIFEFEQLPKLKSAELKEIVDLYIKGGIEAHKDDIKTVADKINFIKRAFEEAGGYPHELTEEDMAKEEWQEIAKTDDTVKVGEIVFVPKPMPEEEVRNGFLLDAEAILADLLTTEELVTKMEELRALDTVALGNEVKAIRESQGLPKAPSDMQNDTKNVVTTGEPVKTPKADKNPDESKAGANPVKVDADTPAHELLDKAVASGNFKFEGVNIIGYMPKVMFGQVRYELYGNDGATYTIEKHQVEKVTKLYV